MKLSSARIISAILMGISFGWYTHHGYLKWNRLGREAFAAHELSRFDHYMASPRPLALTIFGSIIVVPLFLAVYELVTLGLSKILKDDLEITKTTQS